MRNAGIVDLCPCISITFRRRERAVKLLKELSALSPDEYETEMPTRYWVRWWMFRVGTNNKSPCLSHECWIDANHGIKVHNKTILSLRESGRLVMQSRYTAYIPKERPASTLSCRPVWACPHREILSFLTSAKLSHCCSCCGTCIKRCLGSLNPPVVNVTRDLGKRDWPADNQWLSQCRIMDPDIWKTHRW